MEAKVAQATFEEKTFDYVSFYNQGYSISELGESMGYTYTHMRNMLLKSESKEEVMKILHSWYNELKGE